jgi:heavy metal sensor kinase
MAENFVVAVNAEQNDEEKKQHPTENIVEALDAFRFRDYQFAVISGDDKLVGKTTDFDFPSNLKTRTPESFVDQVIIDESYRVFQHVIRVEGKPFHLFVFHPLTDRLGLEDRLRNTLLLVAPIALLLAGIGGYFVARRSFRSIQQMSDRANLITSQNLHERLPVVNKNDELGNLATVFNDLLDRLDKSFEQQRRFMADASHELRTPLAIVRGESEVALSKADRTAVEYQESLTIVHDESKRLTSIVEDLFTLARADSGNFTVNFSDVYLDEIAAGCVHSVRTLADKRNITINFAAEETQITGDESLLRRLVINLLDNAIKYNQDNGTISVNLKDRELSITNTGPEIPKYEQGEIFDRFYRADKGRSRGIESSTSGAGLGLSISKWIADVHGGELLLVNSDKTSTTFSVRFPAHHADVLK